MTYQILQLKRGEENHYRRFEGLDRLNKMGEKPERKNYDVVYEGRLFKSGSAIQTLEDLYFTFNMDHPKDFRGHSLSVSDVVILGDQAWYCDSYGWAPLKDF